MKASILIALAAASVLALSQLVLPDTADDGLYIVTFEGADDGASADHDSEEDEFDEADFDKDNNDEDNDDGPWGVNASDYTIEKRQTNWTDPNIVVPYKNFRRPSEPIIRYDNSKPRVPWPANSWDCIHSVPLLPPKPYAEAREMLGAFCDNYAIAPWSRQIAVAKSGDVVVYACNTDKERIRVCSREEFAYVEESVFEMHCGQRNAAWARSDEVDMVYGRAWKNQPICEFKSKGKKRMGKTSWVGFPDPELIKRPDIVERMRPWAELEEAEEGA